MVSRGQVGTAKAVLRPCPEGCICTAVLDPRAVLTACIDQSEEMPPVGTIPCEPCFT